MQGLSSQKNPLDIRNSLQNFWGFIADLKDISDI